MRYASIIVLSKTDIVTAEAAAVTMETIASVAPERPIFYSGVKAPMVEAVLNAPSTQSGRGSETSSPKPQQSHMHSHIYASWSWAGGEPVDLALVRQFIAADDMGVWRIKGIVHDVDGASYIVQRAGAQHEIRSAMEGEDGGESRIVAVGLAGRFDPVGAGKRWQLVLENAERP